jgi:integrative and conjugative element protein (TIGR02256 family)
MAEILISDIAQATILAAAQGAHPNEAGGILVGVRGADRPWITHALEIPASTVGASHYVLPAGVTRPLVRCVRRVDKRLGYLGEWHVHPADGGPSETDRRTLRIIARKSHEPILVIARRASGTYLVDAWIRARLRLVSLKIVRTGALPTVVDEADTPPG